MIGVVHLQSGDQIVLHDNGQVQATKPQLQQIAGLELHTYKRNYSPSSGPFGPKFLYSLAKKLGGQVALEEKPPDPPDMIY